MDYQVIVTPLAKKQLAAISARRVQQRIEATIESLEIDPEKKGKPLVRELAGLRSIRTPGQRYRIIYRVDVSQRIVTIAALGIRKEGDKADIYAIAQKLVRAGLLTLVLLLWAIDVCR